jgi:two-component system nitrate/nitrite response regulator NarL
MATRTKGGTPVWLDVSTVVDGSTTVHLFRDAGPAPAEATHDARLTPREREILRLLAAGASTRAMAERLRVSVPTVRNHVQNLLGKLGVHSRLEAAAYAMRHGAGLAGEDARPRRRPD